MLETGRQSMTPTAFDTEPPEPFSQLMPGVTMQAGDIIKTLGDATDWRTVQESERGRRVPSEDIAVARLETPEGYQRVANDATLQPRYLYWKTSQQSWEPIHEEWVGKDSTAIPRKNDEQVYVSRPLFEPCNARELPIPAHHRELCVGEQVRRGDKIIYVGKDGWETVSEKLRGTDVIATTESNGWLRYCRPVHPQHQTWYVHPEAPAGGSGGWVDPFQRLDQACQQIEKAAARHNQAPYGIIRDSNGQPLLAYDLPEPVLPETAPENSFKYTRELPIPQGWKPLARDNTTRATDLVEISRRMANGTWAPPQWETINVIPGQSQCVGSRHMIRKKKATRGHAFTPANSPDSATAVETAPPHCPVAWEKQSICWIAREMGVDNMVAISLMDKLVPAGFRRLDYNEELREGDALVSLVTATRELTLGDIPETLLGAEANDFYVVRQRVHVTADLAARIAAIESNLAACQAELARIQQETR